MEKEKQAGIAERAQALILSQNIDRLKLSIKDLNDLVKRKDTEIENARKKKEEDSKQIVSSTSSTIFVRTYEL